MQKVGIKFAKILATTRCRAQLTGSLESSAPPLLRTFLQLLKRAFAEVWEIFLHPNFISSLLKSLNSAHPWKYWKRSVMKSRSAVTYFSYNQRKISARRKKKVSSQYLLVRAYRLPSFLCLAWIEPSCRGKAESKAERTQDKTHKALLCLKAFALIVQTSEVLFWISWHATRHIIKENEAFSSREEM